MVTSSLNQPLEKASQEIRLLRITPAGFDETVSCTSFIQSLSEPSSRSFNALSYVWGDANDTVPMIVDGYVKPVTRNLDIALRHLRDPRNKYISDSMTLPLWVDAVCPYVDRYRRKCHRNLMFGPLFSEGFLFSYWIKTPLLPPPVPLYFLSQPLQNFWTRAVAALTRAEP
jgi:hypothetical protein